jgi:hypothetical protein
MSDDILNSRECLDDGCERPAGLLGPRCRLHELVHYAQWLTADDLDELRQAVASIVPLTKRQQAAQKRQMRLKWLTDDARRFEVSVEQTRDTGATQKQIDKAIAAGRSKAVSG